MDSLVSYNTFWVSWHEAMSGLTDEQYGRVSRALNEYCFYGMEPDLSGIEKIIFTMARSNIDSSNKSKIGGKSGGQKRRGGAPEGNRNASKDKSIPPYSENQYPPIEKNNSNGNGNGNGNGNVNEEGNGEESGDSAISESQRLALELSELLFSSHQKEFPDYLSGKSEKQLQKKLEGWAVEIEKLIRLDKKAPETIRQVILWVKTPGNFWFPNIESGKKLREKFERLYGQMTTDSKKAGPRQHRIASDNVSPDELGDYFKEARL